MEDQAQAQSTEDRMMAFLEAEEEQEAAPVTEEEQPAAAETEEVEATPSDEDQAEPRKLKIKRGEEEIEIPEYEAIELAQKGYDYTKKTQALADERKAVEERAQAIQAQEQYFQRQVQVQQALIKEVAKVEALNDQIAQYEQLDWNTLSDTDPVQAQKLFIQYQQLTIKRQNAQEGLARQQGELQAAVDQRRQQMLAEGFKQLSRDIPDWNAEKAAAVRETGKSYGFSDQELSGVSDPRMVRVLHDAAQFRALQKSRPQVEKKVADKPAVVKPGGKDAKAVARSQNTALREQLRKTGNSDIAAKLIEQML